jgi:hypothetical protein
LYGFLWADSAIRLYVKGRSMFGILFFFFHSTIEASPWRLSKSTVCEEFGKPIPNFIDLNLLKNCFQNM